MVYSNTFASEYLIKNKHVTKVLKAADRLANRPIHVQAFNICLVTYWTIWYIGA